jgi:hypothetical protein
MPNNDTIPTWNDVVEVVSDNDIPTWDDVADTGQSKPDTQANKGLVSTPNQEFLNEPLKKSKGKEAMLSSIKDTDEKNIFGSAIDQTENWYKERGGLTPIDKMEQVGERLKQLDKKISAEAIANMNDKDIQQLELDYQNKAKEIANELGLDVDDEGNISVPEGERQMFEDKLAFYLSTESKNKNKEAGFFENFINKLAAGQETFSANTLDMVGAATGLNNIKSYKRLSEGSRLRSEQLSAQANRYDQSIEDYVKSGDVGAAAGLAVSSAFESLPSMIPVFANPSYGLYAMSAMSGIDKYRQIENKDIPEWQKVYNAFISGASEYAGEKLVTIPILTRSKQALLSLGETRGKAAIEQAVKKTVESNASKLGRMPEWVAEGMSEVATGISTDLVDKVTVNPDKKIGEGAGDNFVVGAVMGKIFSLPQDIAQLNDRQTAKKFAKEVVDKLPADMDVETKINVAWKIAERDALVNAENKLDEKFKGKYQERIVGLNTEIEKEVGKYSEKAQPTVGKVEPVSDMQNQLDYLKEQEVDVPDGTTAAQLKTLYDETKAKATETESKTETKSEKITPIEDTPAKVVEFTGDELKTNLKDKQDGSNGKGNGISERTGYERTDETQMQREGEQLQLGTEPIVKTEQKGAETAKTDTKDAEKEITERQEVPTVEKIKEVKSGTKLVDTKGKPLTVYQGRSKKGLKSLFNKGEGWFSVHRGVGVQYADSEKHIKLYNTPEKYETVTNDELKGEIYEATLDVQNPMFVELGETLWNREKERAKIEEAKTNGHDAVVIVQDGKPRDIVVFNENQINTPQTEPTVKQEKEIKSTISESQNIDNQNKPVVNDKTKSETVKPIKQKELPISKVFTKATKALNLVGKETTSMLGKTARNGKINGVDVVVQQGNTDNEIIIESMRTPSSFRQKGKATKALQTITEQADKDGITLKLRAVPQKVNVNVEDIEKRRKEELNKAQVKPKDVSTSRTLKGKSPSSVNLDTGSKKIIIGTSNNSWENDSWFYDTYTIGGKTYYEFKYYGGNENLRSSGFKSRDEMIKAIVDYYNKGEIGYAKDSPRSINERYDAETANKNTGITEQQLKSFYEKNGFEFEGIEGVRKPKSVETEKVAEYEIPKSEDGLYQIYPVKVRNKDGGIDNYFGVPTIENKENKGFGDGLHRNLKDAIAEAEQNRIDEVRLAKQNAERAEEQRKAEEAAQAKKEANKGKTKLELMNEAKDAKILNTKERRNGIFKTRKEHVEDTINNGGYTEIAQVNKVNDVSRTTYNRMDGRQQDDLERRIKEGGKKNEYRIFNKDGSFRIVTKAEYDYANKIVSKQSKSTEDGKEKRQGQGRQEVLTAEKESDITGDKSGNVTETEVQKITPQDKAEAAKAKIAQGFSDLADLIGAKKSLTGEQRESAIKAIQRIIEGLVELGIAKGMSIKDAVLKYAKDNKFTIPEDLIDEAIAQNQPKFTEQYPIGTTNAKVRTSREMRGLDAIPKADRVANKDLWQSVVDKIANGIINPRQTVKDILSTPILELETNATKEAIVKWDRIRILKETKYTVEEIEAKQQANDNTGLVDLWLRKSELEIELEQNDLAAAKLGNVGGSTLQFRQRNLEEDMSLAAIIREAKILNGGKELTVKQEQRFKQLSEKFEKLQAEYDKLRGQEQERQDKAKAEEDKKRKAAEQKLINDIQNNLIRQTPKAMRDFDTQFKADVRKQKLSEKENTIKERLKERLGRLANLQFAVGEEGSAMIVEELSGVIKDMSELGIVKLEQGIDRIISKVKDYMMSVDKKFDGKNLDKYKDEIKESLGIEKVVDGEYERLITKLVEKSILGFDTGVKSILNEIVYNRVVSGRETIDDVVDDIYESVKDRIANIDKRKIRDAISGYGEFRKLSKEEADIKVRELKRQGRLDSAIEDVEDKNQLPLRTGVERDTQTQQTRQKQARILKEIKERDLVPPPTEDEQETQWRNGLQAYQRRLENAIEDIEKEIATGERKAKSQSKKYDSPELDILRTELERLKKVREAIDKESGKYVEQREQAIIKATERAIAELEMDIDKMRQGIPTDKTVTTKGKGVFGLSKAKKEKITSERIEELRKLKESLQQQLSELMPDAIKDKALLEKYKQQRQRRLEQLLEQQRTKDYGERPKPYRPTLDKATIEINRSIERLKYDIEKEKEQIRLDNRTWKERLGESVLNAWNLPKALMASIDLSAPFRQGIVMISKPKLFGKAFKEMFVYAFSKNAYEDWLFDLKTTDAYYEMIENGLYIAEPTAKLSAKEENFMSNWLRYVDKIPLYGAFRAGSERAYIGFLNKLRIDVYLNFQQKLNKTELTKDEITEELKSYSHFINTATGRGKLSMKFGQKEVFTLEGVAPVLNSVFFSPRLIASRLAAFNPAFYANMSSRTRKDAIKTYLGSAGIIMSTLMLSAIAFYDDDKFEIETDPRSADFMKIRYGNILYDLWGGHQQVARTLSQVITGQVKKDGKVQKMEGNKWYGQTRANVLTKFFSNKLSPSAALIKDILQGGKDYEGNDITVTGELINKTMPLYLRDVKEAVQEEGWEFTFIAGFPALFGVGVQTYAKTKKEGTGNTETDYIEQLPEEIPDMSFMEAIDGYEQTIPENPEWMDIE